MPGYMRIDGRQGERGGTQGVLPRRSMRATRHVEAIGSAVISESRQKIETGGNELLVQKDKAGGEMLGGTFGKLRPSKGYRGAPAPRWCPMGLSKTQRCRLQKMRQKELAKKERERKRDEWYAQARPMVVPRKIWREKWLAREEKDEGEINDGSSEDKGQASNVEVMEVSMVFMIPAEFRAPKEAEVAEMVVGAERAMFEKPKEAGSHMKPLYIKGHVDGKPVGRMMVDGGVSINIMPLATFQRLGHRKEDLKQTNMNLAGFAGEPAEAKGIVSKELTVGCKMIPMVFFVVDVKGRYNLLLGRDWIHANGCVPSNVHQRLMQWSGIRLR
jgi:hypothetical protein